MTDMHPAIPSLDSLMEEAFQYMGPMSLSIPEELQNVYTELVDTHAKFIQQYPLILSCSVAVVAVLITTCLAYSPKTASPKPRIVKEEHPRTQVKSRQDETNLNRNSAIPYVTMDFTYDYDRLPKEYLTLLDKIRTKDVQAVKRFRDEGFQMSFGGDFPLREAILADSLNCLKFLHKDCNVDLDASDGYAIRWASRKGYERIVRYLCENGVDASRQNYCAITWARNENHDEIVRILEHYVEEKTLLETHHSVRASPAKRTNYPHDTPLSKMDGGPHHVQMKRITPIETPQPGHTANVQYDQEGAAFNIHQHDFDYNTPGQY